MQKVYGYAIDSELLADIAGMDTHGLSALSLWLNCDLGDAKSLKLSKNVEFFNACKKAGARIYTVVEKTTSMYDTELITNYILGLPYFNELPNLPVYPNLMGVKFGLTPTPNTYRIDLY